MSGRVGVEQTPDIEAAVVASALLESDALTPNSDGTPTGYVVDAENVEYLVRTVLDLHTPVLAAAVREARAAELREAADALPDATEGPDRIGTATWRPYTRDVYSLAIEEAQGALRDRADRIAVDAPECPRGCLNRLAPQCVIHRTEGGEGR